MFVDLFQIFFPTQSSLYLDDIVELTILKKETMFLKLHSVAKRDQLLREFHAGITLAANRKYTQLACFGH